MGDTSMRHFSERCKPSIILLALLFLSVALPSFAREVEVFVEDLELNLPLEGAVVRLPDGRQYVCDLDGRAVFYVPPNTQMMVQVSYPGYDTARLVIVPGQDRYTVGLWLSGIMEGRELVVEATRPGGGQTVTGRSVAVTGREITQTAEIGIVEDVMATIRLLPGVGYTGLFNTQPSIRGGDPGDMRAVLDGFYVFNPFHWDGNFSIFDPRMVESVQLSHGVFSARYGHTISGLLNIRTKNPSPTEVELEIGASSSAASFGLSLPLGGRGGILFMGRITYYDPVVALAQRLSGFYEPLEIVNFIQVAPYIRSGTITGSYRISDRLEFGGTAFLGMDGTGAGFRDSTSMYNPNTGEFIKSHLVANMDFATYQGFAIGRLAWNPRGDMLLRFTAGLGYTDRVFDNYTQTDIEEKSFSQGFMDTWGLLGNIGGFDFAPYSHSSRNFSQESELMFNAQGRVDFDWELRDGLLLAIGLQEKFSQFRRTRTRQVYRQRRLRDFARDDRDAILGSLGVTNPLLQAVLERNLMVNMPFSYNLDARTTMFASSGYILAEYTTPGRRFGAELGLRVDHYHLIGEDFSQGTTPALSPRLNMDFNVLRNLGIIESMSVAAGTGLFSSMSNAVFASEQGFHVDGLRPNRSWSSVLGMLLEFPEGLSLNVEAYYRHIFDRMYVTRSFGFDGDTGVQPHFDGVGGVWGIDLMLRRMQSRRLDGWLSYSFNWARYFNPQGGNIWHFPSHHRFHNLNLVLNVRPTPRFNIYTRFGIASGSQLSRLVGDAPLSFPVYVFNPETGTGYFIERYFWPSERDENNRSSPSLPMDVKFSLFGRNREGRGMARWELYFAVENVLGLLSSQLGLSQGNAGFNPYTGQVNQGIHAATYQIPIPIPSFGLRITF